MSLESLCTDRVTVQRQAASRDASGGPLQNYASVSGLMEVFASIQPMHGHAVRTQGQRQVFLTHHVYFPRRIDVRRGDRLYVPATGQFFVVHGFEDMAGRGVCWRAECKLET